MKDFTNRVATPPQILDVFGKSPDKEFAIAFIGRKGPVVNVKPTDL